MSQKVSMFTIGIDLGDKLSEVCVLDREGQEVERSSIRTAPLVFRTVFERYRGATAVFEVGSQSRWVQPLARKEGLLTIAADPRQLKLITASHKKTDRKDAYILARAGQAMPELLCPVEHRSDEHHADLALMKTREALVAMRTKFVCRIRGLLKAKGGKIVGISATYFFKNAPAEIPDDLRAACAPLFAVLETIHTQLLQIGRQSKALAADRYPAVSRLQEIPGVGLRTALTFVLTIGDARRFKKARDVGAYLGLTPKKRESGDAAPQLGITKRGDRSMRRLLVLCAHQILGPFGKDSYLRQWGLELSRRGGRNAKKRAVVAVARKLAIRMLAVWKSERPYEIWRDQPTVQIQESK